MSLNKELRKIEKIQCCANLIFSFVFRCRHFEFEAQIKAENVYLSLPYGANYMGQLSSWLLEEK